MENLCLICGKIRSKRNLIVCSKKCSAELKKRNDYDNYEEKIKKKIIENCEISSNNCWIWMKSSQKSGYPKITFRNKTLKGNRVSYTVFKGKISGNLLVCHTCDNPQCLNPDHLYLGSHLDNLNDKLQRRRQAKGESQGLSKLNEENVYKIREMYSLGHSQEDIAVKYHVHQGTISKIVLKKTWKHI